MWDLIGPDPKHLEDHERKVRAACRVRHLLLSGTAGAALYSEAACPTEAVFFVFCLKAPACFFWGCAFEG
jgi:hypothetical protein